MKEHTDPHEPPTVVEVAEVLSIAKAVQDKG